MRKLVSIKERVERSGAPRPPYCEFNTIAELFSRYEVELAGRAVEDQLGTRVWFQDYNFPKLIQLSFRGSKAKATAALLHLRGFGSEREYGYDLHRARTLFWIPQVISTADSIYLNGHSRIAGDLIYVKRYAKAGAALKVVFTQIDEASNQRIVTTSFLTDDEGLKRFVTSKPMWAAKGNPLAVAQSERLDIAAGAEGD
jgi:hypothetical protein